MSELKRKFMLIEFFSEMAQIMHMVPWFIKMDIIVNLPVTFN